MLAISILVLLHEGGHFFFSKLFGVRVEKFYLFFDPWFHLFEWKPKKSDTTYGVGWLPLGGYCVIAPAATPKETSTNGKIIVSPI